MGTRGRGDPDLMPLLENALAKLPSTDSALRIRRAAWPEARSPMSPKRNSDGRN